MVSIIIYQYILVQEIYILQQHRYHPRNHHTQFPILHTDTLQLFPRLQCLHQPIEYPQLYTRLCLSNIRVMVLILYLLELSAHVTPASSKWLQSWFGSYGQSSSLDSDPSHITSSKNMSSLPCPKCANEWCVAPVDKDCI